MAKAAFRSRRNLWVALSAVVIIIAGLTWGYKVYSSPRNAFYGMLGNNLTTSSYVRQTTEPTGDGTLDQYNQLQLNDPTFARSMTTITRGSGSLKTTVTTESLSTLGADYVRYVAIETPPTEGQTEAPNFSALLNVWGKQETSEDKKTAGVMFTESLLGVVPIGNLSRAARQDVLQFMAEKNVYEVDFAKAEQIQHQGRAAYVLKTKINPHAYVNMLKLFMQKLGQDSSALDPSVYQQAEPIEIELIVGKLSRQLFQIRYPGTQKKELYSDFGLNSQLSLPAETIPLVELQSRLFKPQQ